MADNNELKIKISLDKSSIEQTKAYSRQMIAQIKADAQRSIKEIEALGKIEVAQENNRSKEKIAFKKIELAEKIRLEKQSAQEEKRIKQESASEQKRISKQIAEQEKRDAEQVRASKQRMYNQMFGQKKSGNSVMYLSELGENFTAIGVGIGLVFNQIQKYLGDAITKSIEFDKSLSRLKFTTDNITFQNLKTFNKDFKFGSLFGTKDIMNAESFLASQGRTEEQIKKTIKAAMDLSVVTGDDLDGAVRKLDMTYEGSLGRLGRLDGSLKNLTQAELENGVAIDIIGAKYQGLADNQATTLGGKIQILEKNYEGLKKSLGDTLILEVGKFFGILSTKVTDLESGFNSAKNAIDGVISGVGSMLRIMPNLYTVFKGVSDGVTGLTDFFRVFTDSTYSIGDAFSDLGMKMLNILPQARLVKEGLDAIRRGWNSLTGGDNTEGGDAFAFQKRMLEMNKKFGSRDMIPEGVVGYTRDGKPITKEWADFYSKTFANDTRGGTKTGSNSPKVQEEKEILNAYQKQSEIIEQIKKDLELNVGYAGEELDLRKKLFEAEQKLRYIVSGITISNQGTANEEFTPLRDLTEFLSGESFINFSSIAEKIKGSFESGLSLAGEITNVLSTGADSFISKFINGFNQVYNLANGLIGFLNTIFAGSTSIFGGGLFGLIGGLLGFADGGLVSGSGSGRSDSILARVSNGEFIMNAESTRQNLPLLMAMNSGANIYIGSSIDGIKFFRSSFPDYENFRNKKRL